MSHVEVALHAPLKQAVLQAFTKDYFTLNESKSYRTIARQGHRQLAQAFQSMLDSGINPYESLKLEHATMEVFGWRRPLIEFEGESLWQDAGSNGKPPLESALMVWNKECFPHNHDCHIASYCTLPTYGDEVPDAYYESRWGNTGYIRPGSMIQKFWEKIEPADPGLIGAEGVVCTPIRTGEVVMFREIGETVVAPGQAIVIGPTPYHTLAPVPGYSAASINVYLPPMKRYSGPRQGGVSCQACPDETYNACSIRQAFDIAATAKANRFGHSPAVGGDISALMEPKTVMHEPPALRGGSPDAARFNPQGPKQ